MNTTAGSPVLSGSGECLKNGFNQFSHAFRSPHFAVDKLIATILDS
jgi:hypothetical protein